jgi:SAM-dependent methyltransferase
VNQKIYKQLMADTGGDVTKITREYVAQIFDALIDTTYKTVEQWTTAIDNYCLHRYFSQYWQPDMKKWKYSGLQLIDEVNALHPRSVLDVGCGYNEFRGRINNLIGIDPYNDNADYKIATLDYKTKEKFDVILCLGSINFGTQDKIVREVAHCVSMLEEGGTMFFRVNPGVQHDKPEAHWIEFFAWNVPFIIDLSQQLKLKILDIRDDTNQRKYFIYRKV